MNTTNGQSDGLRAFLRREMPAGTVIGDPDWWADRIARALSITATALASSPPAPGGDALRALVDEWADDDTPILRGDAAAELRAALKLAAAPAPAAINPPLTDSKLIDAPAVEWEAVAKPEGVDSAEDAYVIEQMGRLLAEIAVIVKGPEPANGLWSYHDLPKLVAQIKQATYRSPCCGVGEGELHRDDCTAQIADEMDAWAEKRLSGPHDNRNVRRLLNGWAERLRATRQAQGGGEDPNAL